MPDTQEVRIQVMFRTDTPHGAFQDALWFSKDEYEKLSQKDLDAQKLLRTNNWIALVTAPKVEKTDEEKLILVQRDIDNYAEMLAEVQAEKAIIQASIDAKVISDGK